MTNPKLPVADYPGGPAPWHAVWRAAGRRIGRRGWSWPSAGRGLASVVCVLRSTGLIDGRLGMLGLPSLPVTLTVVMVQDAMPSDLGLAVG